MTLTFWSRLLSPSFESRDLQGIGGVGVRSFLAPIFSLRVSQTLLSTGAGLPVIAEQVFRAHPILVVAAAWPQFPRVPGEAK